MATKKISFDDATPEQLRKFASEYLGINLPSHTKPETTLARIGEAWPNKFIMVDGDEPAAPQQAAAESPVHQPKVIEGDDEETDASPEPEPEVAVAMKEPMVRIVLTEQEGAGGKRAVPVSVNGVAMLIPRNKECDIKLRYYDALKIAVQTLYDYDEQTDDIQDRNVPSYPVTVVRMPPEDEIKAWHAQVAEAEANIREANKAKLAQAKSAA